MVAANKHKVLSPSNLNIVGLNEDVAPDTATDYLAIYDASSGSNKKVLLDNLGLGGGNSFATMQPDVGTSPVASSGTDTLTMTSSDGSVLITGNSGTDTLDFSLIGRGSTGGSLFIGTDAGLGDDLTANSNIGIGNDSLKATTTGIENVALGVNTGSNNVSGSYNTSIGFGAFLGASGNSSANNTGLGYKAGFANTTGEANTYIGARTAAIGTTGSNNVVLGYNINLPSSSTSNYLNIGGIITGDISTGEIDLAALATTAIPLTISAIASQTANLFETQDSSATTLFRVDSTGAAVLRTSVNASDLALVRGDAADHGMAFTGTTGNRSTRIMSDSFAIDINKGGITQYTGSGYFKANSGGSIGAAVFCYRGDTNTGLYFPAADDVSLTAGSIQGLGCNTTIGYSKLPFQTAQYATGSLPTASSYEGSTVYDTTTNEVKFSDGATWAAFGGGASSLDDLSDAASGGNSYFIGTDAGLNDDGTTNANVGIGYFSLKENTSGSNNVGLGSQSGQLNTSGSNNLSIGYQANLLNTSGSANVGVGANSNFYNISGSNNVGVGLQTLYGASGSTASNNTAIGFQAGHFCQGTATENTCIGYQAGFASTTGNYNILIGSGAEASSATASSELNIGDIITGDISTGAINLTALATTAIPLTLGGIASQTADLLRIEDSSNTLLSSFKSDGTLEMPITATNTTTIRGAGDTTRGICFTGTGASSDIYLYVGNTANTGLKVGKNGCVGFGTIYGFASGPNGTASGPAITFNNDKDTGMYRLSSNIMAFSSGAVQTMEISTTIVESKLPVQFASYATGSLPTASSYEGTTVYDTTTNELKYSDGATWDGLSGSGTPVTIPSVIPAAATLVANKVQYYITEGANSLNFKMKYADGTTKRAKLPLYEAPDWANAKQYTLDNTDDYFTSEITGEELGLSGATAFTISVIVDFDMVANDEFTWFSLFAGTGTGKLELYRINSAIRFIIDGAYTDIAPTRIDGLYHLVFVYDGSLGSDILRAKIYHNGSDATTTGSGTIPASVNVEIADSQLGIGNRYTAGANYYDGSIQEMNIWNKALTSTEVTSLYNSGSYSDPTAISGCISSWWFGDNPSDNRVKVVDNIGYNDLTGQNLDSGVITTI